jgi:hypothetical protein
MVDSNIVQNETMIHSKYQPIYKNRDGFCNRRKMIELSGKTCYAIMMFLILKN